MLHILSIAGLAIELMIKLIKIRLEHKCLSKKSIPAYVHRAECVSVGRWTLDTPASGYCTEPLTLRPARLYQHNDITFWGWGCHWA